MTDEELLATVRLALTPHVGPKTMAALLARFGSPVEVFRAAPSELRSVPGVGVRTLGDLLDKQSLARAEDELAFCTEHQVAIVPLGSPDYPNRLAEIPDAPPLLFLRGALAPQDDLAVAIVGTRGATLYGKRIAGELASALSYAGYTVVSGLAAGIDEHAHRGALNGQGRTLAVLGSGVSEIYPAQNIPLAEQILAEGRGALLGENPPRTRPDKFVFPRRNRLITGLSLGTIVVEADVASGAMISARLAGEQGREVFAVPGPIDRHTSRGCHRLIRDGAKLVESIEDVLEELGPLATPAKKATGETVRHPAELQLNEIETKILQAVATEATLIDDVIATSGVPAPRVLSTLSVLEMRRLVRRISGHQVVRV